MANIGIFGSLFDLNGDGELNCVERALEFAVLEDLMEKDTDSDSLFDDWEDSDFD